MIPDGAYVAVVDRFEDNLAVLEVSADDDLYELVADEENLPKGGRHSDAVFHVTVRDGDVIAATYDAEETNERQNRAKHRFDRLSKRPPQPEEDDDE